MKVPTKAELSRLMQLWKKKSLGMILNTKKRIESHSEECREYVVMYLQLY